jgi:DNA-binding ferritin-like protein
MEVKLDHALANVTDHESRIRVLEDHNDPATADHESRIRSLESAKWMLAGFAAALGGGAGAIASKIIGG